MSKRDRLCDEHCDGPALGCIELLYNCLVKTINDFIAQTIIDGARSTEHTTFHLYHRHNSLFVKLQYLNGNRVRAYDTSDMNVEFKVRQKISNDVFNLFDEISDQTNIRVLLTSAYDVINSFATIVLVTTTNKYVKFTTDTFDLLTADTDDCGTNYVDSPSFVDMEPCIASNSDMCIECYTNKEYQMISNNPLLPNTTHVFVLFYGTREQIIQFTRHSFRACKPAFWSCGVYDRSTLYFKFRLPRLIERLKIS